MKLASKLLLPPMAATLVALAGGASVGALLHHEAGLTASAHADDLEDQRTIASARDQLGRLHAGVYRTLTLIGSMDEGTVSRFRSDLAAQSKGIQRVIDALGQSDAENRPLQDSVKQVGEQMTSYAKAADQAIDLATVDPNTGVAAMQTADDSFKAAAQGLSHVTEVIDAATEQKQTLSEQRVNHMTLGLGLVSLLLTAAVLVASTRMLRRLARSLNDAAQVAEAVAEGDLTAPRNTDRSDEIGDLQRGLARMVDRLQASMHNVRQAAGSIGVVSGEIASGNQDLSQRTELAAGSLQQTASSMSELTASVGQSAEAASQANQLAGSASVVAQRGGEAMSQVVSTMDEIHEASRKIGDIIGVIDGIAFQTNILALNAAVEAARAGEQGRGFAVVAAEVRSLAQRSAEAAREIKTLIGASMDRVESGSRLVKDAGSTMDDIVASVRNVSGIVAEITAATSEQRDGIGQVNQAVAQLDQMTQQNAALVEQSAAAAESMKAQAARLNEVVAAFKLSDSATPPAMPVLAGAPAHERLAQSALQRARSGPPSGAVPATLPRESDADSDWESF